MRQSPDACVELRTPLLALFVVLASAWCATSAQAAESNRPALRFGLVIDGPWARNGEIGEVYLKELRELLDRDYEISLAQEKIRVGDWSAGSIEKAVDDALADNDVDVLLAMGPISSHEVSTRGPLSKPTVAPFVLDVQLQGLPFELGTSGVHNLNYLMAASDFNSQLRAFREIVDFRHLAVLSNPAYDAIIQGLRREQMDTLGGEFGFDIVSIPMPDSGGEALAAIPAEIDAVFVTPVLHLAEKEFQIVVDGLIERKLPSFSVMGRNEVDLGLLAGLTPESDWQRRARRVALNVQRILRGEDAGSLPVAFGLRERLTINMGTARAIGVYPSWDVMTEAVVVNDTQKPAERRYSLESVVHEVLESNLEFKVATRAVAIGLTDVRGARANLYPQTEIGLTGLAIDEDRAAASFGSAPERSFDVAAAVTQVVWSEAARAGVDVEEHLQELREAEAYTVRLDVVQQVVAAYLDVLRAKTLEDIRKENLKVTRSNLELARIRRSIGVSGPGEVYRWESQIATDRKEVIVVAAQRNIAEIQLNRLLDRPGEEPFATEEVTLEDLEFVTSDDRLTPYIDDKWSFSVFRDFMVAEARAAAPELRQLDAAIAAQERVLSSTKASLWSPIIALRGDLGHRLAKGGEGTGSDGGGEIPFAVPESDDTTWSVGLGASLSPYTGGSKRAARDGAAEELVRLRLERDLAADRVEQRIRSALHRTGASFAGIGLSAAAATSAERNLEVVMDGYQRGTVAVLDLLDAQNAALVSRSRAASSVYDFAADVNDVERACGTYRLLNTEDGRNDFFKRLQVHMSAAEARLH